MPRAIFAPIPRGVICLWAGALAGVPPGWALCDGTQGTPDLRAQFVKGAAAGVEPGTTGGSPTHDHAFTPAGTVSQPTFTGDALAEHSHYYTPQGTIQQAVFTGAALDNHSHTFTGAALANHAHGVGTLAVSAQVTDITIDDHVATNGVAYTPVPDCIYLSPIVHTVNDAGHAHDLSGTTAATSGGTPSGTNSQESAGTPNGTINSQTFTGAYDATTAVSAGTPSGTISVPVFTGTPGTTGPAASEPAYYEVAYIMKL